ncbi:hypothetical protein [Actinoallomurus sp. CA-150999]|uniref:hypothetical protein n=1 Tax=Actinoallomurus sp. CA-150999 TaxID=3239887 RepID=UPI003D8C24FC
MQIAGRLVEGDPADLRMCVSHETIYQTLCLQARGELRTELKVCLRQGPGLSVVRGVRRGSSRPGSLALVNICQRPRAFRWAALVLVVAGVIVRAPCRLEQ